MKKGEREGGGGVADAAAVLKEDISRTSVIYEEECDEMDLDDDEEEDRH